MTYQPLLIRLCAVWEGIYPYFFENVQPSRKPHRHKNHRFLTPLGQWRDIDGSLSKADLTRVSIYQSQIISAQSNNTTLRPTGCSWAFSEMEEKWQSSRSRGLSEFLPPRNSDFPPKSGGMISVWRETCCTNPYYHCICCAGDFLRKLTLDRRMIEVANADDAFDDIRESPEFQQLINSSRNWFP